MPRLCISCHYIGEPSFSFWGGNIYLGIILSIIGLLGLPINGHFFGSRLIYIVSVLLVLFVGIMHLIGYYRGANNCPKCGNEMLSLDNPEAIEIIKKHDLKPGDNPPPSPETSV